jgi:hypothetical protein
MKKLLLALLASTFFFNINAQEQCGEFDFDEMEYVSVAKIQGRAGTRAYFHTDDTACMSNGTCRKPQFIVPNDYIIAASATDHSACGLYVNGRTGVQTRGWIKGSQISYQSAPALATWAGTWASDAGATIVVTVRNGRISARGNTSLGNRTGSFSATGTVESGILNLTNEDCKLRLANLGQQLYVADNGMCGGMNVTFNNSYKKRVVR